MIYISRFPAVNSLSIRVARQTQPSFSYTKATMPSADLLNPLSYLGVNKHRLKKSYRGERAGRIKTGIMTARKLVERYFFKHKFGDIFTILKHILIKIT